MRLSFALALALLWLPQAGTAVSERVVLVSSREAVQPTEVSVAINPVLPGNVVAVSLQRREPTTNFAYVSFDSGGSWTEVAGPNPEGRTQGDDSIRFDAAGAAYWSYLSFRGLREERPESPANGIFVNRSLDGGRSWDAPFTAVDHRNTITPFEDKPYLAADRVEGSPYRGRVYLSWTRFSKYGSADPVDESHIFFSTSLDGGRGFSPPRRISDRPGDALDGDGTLEGAVPAIGLAGEVYVIWSGPRGLELDKSTDGGLSFGEDRVIAPHPGGWDLEIEGLGRANGMPVTAVDASHGRHRGTLYVNWVDDRNGDPDVFVAYSRDRGESWSEPVRVNDDPVSNGAAQFFTWMAVDPEDGSVNVVFYDRRGGRGTETGVTLARSTDGGERFTNHPVEVEPFETRADVFFGDYIGIDALGGKVIAVFSRFTGEKRLALLAALFDFTER